MNATAPRQDELGTESSNRNRPDEGTQPHEVAPKTPGWPIEFVDREGQGETSVSLRHYHGPTDHVLHEPKRAGAYSPLSEWIGVVLRVGDLTFDARLKDSISGVNRVAEGIPLNEVEEHEQHLVVAGAVFYWSIGYRCWNDGRRDRMSSLMMRRLPVWDQQKLDDAEKMAEDLLRSGRFL